MPLQSCQPTWACTSWCVVRVHGNRSVCVSHVEPPQRSYLFDRSGTQPNLYRSAFPHSLAVRCRPKRHTALKPVKENLAHCWPRTASQAGPTPSDQASRTLTCTQVSGVWSTKVSAMPSWPLKVCQVSSFSSTCGPASNVSTVKSASEPRQRTSHSAQSRFQATLEGRVLPFACFW